MKLLDRYQCKLLRCEELVDEKEESYNIRWEASWISAGSVWLFDLAEQIKWEIDPKVPDPTKVFAFSWKRVGQTFLRAFQTGKIALPVYVVEGTTRLRVLSERRRVQLVESIDLVQEADRSRLQNRIVAQELACWLDVSRRPIHLDEQEWAAMVRQRILSNVPGAGPLDVDPNEDGPEAIYAFGIACLAAFSILYQFLAQEVAGGQGSVSALCAEAEKLEIGSGYFSECFGSYGDGPFI